MKKYDFFIQKRGLSEMISYVILIAITLGMSIAVFSWLKYQVPTCKDSDPDCFIPKDCKIDTSLIINNYSCSSGIFSMNILNNGRFNISGVLLSVSDTHGKIPNEYLVPIDSTSRANYGEFIFIRSLKPGEDYDVQFSSRTKKGNNLTQISELKMQIFIFEGKSKILCRDSLIKESVTNCNLQ